MNILCWITIIRRNGNMDSIETIVENFIKQNKIYCPESIYQSDRVIQNAYEFIEQLCDIVGYYDDEDE